MHITEEDIHKKRQELGLESSNNSHGPEGANNSLKAEMTAEAAEGDQADQVERQQFRQPAGTTQKNQYRYGGERP